MQADRKHPGFYSGHPAAPDLCSERNMILELISIYLETFCTSLLLPPRDHGYLCHRSPSCRCPTEPGSSSGASPPRLWPVSPGRHHRGSWRGSVCVCCPAGTDHNGVDELWPLNRQVVMERLLLARRYYCSSRSCRWSPDIIHSP